MQYELPSASPTQFERNWAMLAHLTALLTVAIGLATGATGTVVALLVPLGMVLYFAGQSRYVAFHALQSTVFQAAFGILYVATAALTGAVIAGAWVVTGLLSVVLVGLLLVPITIGLTLLGAFELAVLPVAGLAYALRGAYLTYMGQDFEYPWVGRLAARTLVGSFTAGRAEA